MDKKNLLGLLVVLLMVVGLAAQCATPTAAPPSEEKPTEEVQVTEEKEEVAKFKVGLVTDVGKVDDGTFNEYAYTGMMRAVEELGLESAFIETQQPTDYDKNVEQFVDEGYDMIVTVGFMMGETTQKQAEANPDIKFAIVDYSYDPAIPNVMGLVFREDQAGFLAGALAGMMTESKTTGIVAGMEIPAVKKFRNGYENGVAYVCPDCNKVGVYIDSFTDPARGKAAAESQIAEGADVIFGAGGPTGSGAILGAAQQGVWVIGVDQDEYVTTFKNGGEAGADKILSSAMKRVDVAVYTAVKNAYEGSFEGGTLVLDAAVDGVGLAPFHDTEGAVSDDVKAKLEEIRKGLADGSLDTGVDPASGDLVGEAKPAEGVSFIFGRGGDAVQLDPAVVTDGESFRVTNQGCESLLAYRDETTEVIPSLAEKWESSDDGKEWTFYLRQGVKFQDGTDFNADAVIFNFERWWDEENPYHFEEQVFEYWEAMWGGFKGSDASIVQSIEKVDDYTVKFVLSEPLAPILANMAMPMFSIASPAAFEKYGVDYGTPTAGYVCTGPYQFVEWVTDDHITLKRFPDYWGEVPGNIETIVIRVIPDNSARFLALQAGEIDAMEQANIEDLKTAEESEDVYVLTRPALNTAYLAFNYHIKEFQDVRVRQAIAYAIDQESIVEAFYGGYGEAATNFLPPVVWGHNDAVPGYGYDPDKAVELLTEAGFADGLSEVTLEDGSTIPLTLYYMPVVRFYYPDPEAIGEAMAAQLAAVGIEVKLELAGDWATYLDMRSNGELVGLYQLGWGGDNGDPDNFLGYFFATMQEPVAREGFIQDAEIADMLVEARITPDQAARQKIYEDVEQMLYDNCYRVWIAHNSTPLIFRKEVSGYIPNAVSTDLYKFASVNK